MIKLRSRFALTCLFLLGTTLSIAACASNTRQMSAPEEQGSDGLSNKPLEFVELEQRRAEYEKIFREARRKGLVSGGLRGALVGALVSGEGVGAAAGAMLGALIGSNYAVIAAEKFLQERDDFLNRQAIVDNVLHAARSAANQTERDANIVNKAVDEYSKYGLKLDPEIRQKVSSATVAVTRAAELRALVIEESLQEASVSESEEQEIRLLLKRQIDALARIRYLNKRWDSYSNG